MIITNKQKITNSLAQPPEAWQQNDGYLRQLLTDPWYGHLAQLSSTLFTATHDFFETRSIKPFVFPITTGSVSSPMGLGSDSQPVKIKLRNESVFLADSMQFSLEVAARLNKEGAYYIMPTFRGEPTDARHLNEFVHSEAEVPGGLEQVIELAQSYITYLVNEAANNCEEAIVSTAGNMNHITQCLSKRSKFARIRYEDALKDVQSEEHAVENIGTGHGSITSVGEKILMKRYGDFMWLTNMPWKNVPFYQAQEQGTEYSMTGDLLAGIGEILGCGQRVNTNAELDASLKFHDVSVDGYQWYAEMRDIKPMQTAGFGLGIERLILWLTQTNDIRNCSLLYRDHDQIFFP